MRELKMQLVCRPALGGQSGMERKQTGEGEMESTGGREK